MTITSSGYIIHDNEGIIHGSGPTADAADADMRRTMAAAGIKLLPDDADSTEQQGSWTRESGLKTMPATASLITTIEARGGAITWDTHGGIACTPDEIA